MSDANTELGLTGPMTVHGTRAQIAEIFGMLVAAQPTAWTNTGLVLFPQAGADLTSAARSIARCHLPISTGGPAPTGWPDPPAAMIAGIYRRSAHHAPAPTEIPEVLQVSGEGFGPGDHPTTQMCLSSLRRLPPGDAVDIGCGSGLLALARARLAAGFIFAIDADPAAARQATASVALSGLDQRIAVATGRAGTLDPDALAGRVVFANVPAPVHKELAARMSAPPRALLVSGLTTTDAKPALARYLALGMRRTAASQRGRWQCHLLVALDA